jgi:hypothetical protein
MAACALAFMVIRRVLDLIGLGPSPDASTVDNTPYADVCTSDCKLVTVVVAAGRCGASPSSRQCASAL